MLIEDYNMYLTKLMTNLRNTLNFHWNVTGALFLNLHELYGEQYEFFFESIDKLAEMIKSMGGYPLENFDPSKEDILKSKDYEAKKTIEYQIEAFENLFNIASECAKKAEEKNDYPGVDFFTNQMVFLSNQLYFLRQLLN